MSEFMNMNMGSEGRDMFLIQYFKHFIGFVFMFAQFANTWPISILLSIYISCSCHRLSDS